MCVDRHKIKHEFLYYFELCELNVLRFDAIRNLHRALFVAAGSNWTLSKNNILNNHLTIAFGWTSELWIKSIRCSASLGSNDRSLMIYVTLKDLFCAYLYNVSKYKSFQFKLSRCSRTWNYWICKIGITNLWFIRECVCTYEHSNSYMVHT